jgi:ABC-type phosphate transport system substrate-binding protein
MKGMTQMSRSLRSPHRGAGVALAGALALLLAALAVLSLAPRASAAFTIPQCEGTGVLGRGASFAQGAHGAWEIPFRNNFCGGTGPDIQYDPAGSGAGINGMKERTPTSPRFGGTDDPLSTTQKNDIQNGTVAVGDEGKVHQVPIAVGAVAPLVNFPNGCDVTKLPESAETPEQNLDGDGTQDDVVRVKFTKAQYEAIWAQGATTGGAAPYVDWDDVFPALAGDAACEKPVIRVVRFDNSGTTFAFKDFLSKIEGARGWVTTFQEGTNGNREWPGAEFGSTGQCGGTAAPGKKPDAEDHLTSACTGNAENLTQKLIETDGSIGYADIATARGKGLAIEPEKNDNDVYWTQLQNGNDEFKEPTVDPNGFRTDGSTGANCGSTEFTGVPATTLDDWSKATGVNSKVGYGLCTMTYGLLFDDNADTFGVSALEEERARTVKDYFTFVVSTEGQNLLTTKDYVKLPPAILSIAQAGVSSIDWNKGEGGTENPPPSGGGNNQPLAGNNPPPVVVPPSNAFSVTKKAISSKNGKATISLKLPGPGKVVMVGKAKNGKKAISVGKVTLNAGKAGTFNLTLNPSGAAKQVLKQAGSLKVNLTITFTPTGGSAKSSKTSVTLKLK